MHPTEKLEGCRWCGCFPLEGRNCVSRFFLPGVVLELSAFFQMAKWREECTTLSLASSESSSSGVEEIELSDGDEEVLEMRVPVSAAEERANNKRGKKRPFDQTEGERKNRKKFRMEGGKMSSKKRARQNQRQKRQQKQRSL